MPTQNRSTVSAMGQEINKISRGNPRNRQANQSQKKSETSCRQWQRETRAESESCRTFFEQGWEAAAGSGGEAEAEGEDVRAAVEAVSTDATNVQDPFISANLSIAIALRAPTNLPPDPDHHESSNRFSPPSSSSFLFFFPVFLAAKGQKAFKYIPASTNDIGYNFGSASAATSAAAVMIWTVGIELAVEVAS